MSEIKNKKYYLGINFSFDIREGNSVQLFRERFSKLYHHWSSTIIFFLQLLSYQMLHNGQNGLIFQGEQPLQSIHIIYFHHHLFPWQLITHFDFGFGLEVCLTISRCQMHFRINSWHKTLDHFNGNYHTPSWRNFYPFPCFRRFPKHQRKQDSKNFILVPLELNPNLDCQC